MASRQGNKLGRSCVTEERAAPLSSDFGMKMLREKFAEDADAILAKLGTITRGPRKGLPRGELTWVKCIEGGWDYGTGRVRYPGASDWDVKPDAYSPRSVVAEVRRERLQREQAAKEAEWDSKTEAEKTVERALRCRRSALADLRHNDLEEFHHRMQRARGYLRVARTLMEA